MLGIFTQIIIMITFAISTYTQQFETPPIWSQERENIRLYEIRQVNEPNIMLKKVYKRQVYKLSSLDKQSNASMIDQFSVCKQSPPEISFKNIGYYRLDQPISSYSDTQQVTNSSQIVRKTNTIIYDYEVLKNKYQNIIDMVHHEGYIFTISSTANISVYTMTNDDNGIQLKSSQKGIYWDDLYKYRYQNWLQYENKQKQRQDLIQKRKNQTINSKINNTNTQNKTDSSTEQQQHNTIVNTSQQNENKTISRRLQSAPSPKVYEDKKSTSQSNSKLDEGSKQNSTQQIYYIGPPPQIIRPHLQKGYFQLMDNNKLLIFANNQYLIAYDINKNWCFLLSQQPQYDYLFAKKQAQKEKNVTNSTQNKTDYSNNTSSDKNLTIDNQQTNTTSDSTNTTNSTSKEQITDKKVQNSTQSQQTTQPIPDPQPIILPEFVTMPQFQQIAKINETHFALVDKKAGIYIYQIVQQKPQKFTSYSNNPSNYYLKKTAFLGKGQFGNTFDQHQQLNLVDITFNKNKGLLLVLDYEKGVFAFQQKIQNISKKVNETQQIKHGFVLSPYTIIKKMCNLMQFSQLSQQLFLSCNKIYRISLKNWPKIAQKIYPHPLINIRQIYIEQQMNIIILSGYSVFKVMYLDRTANYFQDDMLDKIIFHKDTVITANENHIIALRYNVQKPAIICQAQNSSLLGMHNILIRTTAQCSQEYLRFINYTIPQNQTFSEDDVCVYNVQKTIYIWQQGEVPLKPLAIVMLVFLIFICVMIIWFILIRCRVQRAQQHLKYLSEEGQTGHKTLVQQQEQKKSVRDQKQLQSDQIGPEQANKQSDISINTDEQDRNKDLYSIE